MIDQTLMVFELVDVVGSIIGFLRPELMDSAGFRFVPVVVSCVLAVHDVRIQKI